MPFDTAAGLELPTAGCAIYKSHVECDLKKKKKKKVRFGLDVLSAGGTVSYWPLVEKYKIAISSGPVPIKYFLPTWQPAM